jgi:hypothetical protein
MNAWMRRSAGVVIISAAIMAAGATAAQADDDFQDGIAYSESSNDFFNRTYQPNQQMNNGDNGVNYNAPRNTTTNRQNSRANSEFSPSYERRHNLWSSVSFLPW